MFNPFSAIVNFFKKLGKHLGPAIHLITQVITEEQFDKALEYVALAAANATFDNANRQTQVVSKLQAIGMPEHLARLAMEMAVTQLKHAEDAGVTKLEDLYKAEAEQAAAQAALPVVPTLPDGTLLLPLPSAGLPAVPAAEPAVEPAAVPAGTVTPVAVVPVEEPTAPAVVPADQQPPSE